MPVADRFTVVLDANVLYPFVQRDVLLSLAKAGLFRARWTDEIVDEWTRNLLERKPHLTPNIERTVEVMRAAFEESWVDGYEPLIEALTLPDRNDRHGEPDSAARRTPVGLGGACPAKARTLGIDRPTGRPRLESTRSGLSPIKQESDPCKSGHSPANLPVRLRPFGGQDR